MLYSELESCFLRYTSDVIAGRNDTLESAFFKCFIKFERFISELFVEYLLGKPSEKGFYPKRLILFDSIEKIEKLLRLNGRTYIDYFKLATQNGDVFFDNSPFSFFTETADYSTVLSQAEAIRNHIAHESTDSKRSYLRKVLFDDVFIEPGDYLANDRKGVRPTITNFSFFINSFKEMADLAMNKID